MHVRVGNLSHVLSQLLAAGTEYTLFFFHYLQTVKSHWASQFYTTPLLLTFSLLITYLLLKEVHSPMFQNMLHLFSPCILLLAINLRLSVTTYKNDPCILTFGPSRLWTGISNHLDVAVYRFLAVTSNSTSLKQCYSSLILHPWHIPNLSIFLLPILN